MKKRLLSMIICAVLLCTMIPATAFAKDTPSQLTFTDSVSNKTVAKGDKVDIYVTLTDDATYPIVGKTITVKEESAELGNGATDLLGNATITIDTSSLSSGSHTLTVGFAGGEGYAPTSLSYELTVTGSSSYDLWVNGEQFASDKLTITDGNGGTATFDPVSNTLTVDGLVINDYYDGSGEYSFILSELAAPLTINAPKGLKIEDNMFVMSCGIKCLSDLTINGNVEIDEVRTGIVVNDGSSGTPSLTIAGNVVINTKSSGSIALSSEGEMNISGNVNITCEDSTSLVSTGSGLSGDIVIGGNLSVLSYVEGGFAVTSARNAVFGGNVKIGPAPGCTGSGFQHGISAENGNIVMKGQYLDIEVDASAAYPAIRATGELIIPPTHSIILPVGAQEIKYTSFSKVYNTLAESDGATRANHVVIQRTVYDDPSYGIQVGESEHGAVKANKRNASSGEKVTLTVTPERGFTLETLTVKDDKGNEIELTPVTYGEIYTFKMPGRKVSIEATFMEDNFLLNYFVDVKLSDWFYDSVYWAAKNGITNGTDSLHFSPNDPCSRAQVVTLLWRAAGSPAPKSGLQTMFTDVNTDAYYNEAVSWAYENGIINGLGPNAFGSDAEITREQLACMIYRYEQSQGGGFTGSWMFLLDYADRADISSWADEAMHWCVMNGIIEGSDTGMLLPQKSATRAEIVTMLYRYFEL